MSGLPKRRTRRAKVAIRLTYGQLRLDAPQGAAIVCSGVLEALDPLLYRRVFGGQFFK
jgi:hypothetical protein